MERLFAVIDDYFRCDRSVWLIKFKMRIHLVSLAMCFVAVAAPAETINDANVPPSPKSASEIVGSLHDVIAHGDLADEQYYSKKFGVTLKGEGVGEMYRWGPMCGKIKAGRMGQYFNNSSVPWYFDAGRQFMNRCGEYPYRQEFLSNDLVQVVAYIILDAQKICVTTQDVEGALVGLGYSHGPHNRKFAYFFDGKNKINLILFPSGLSGCIGVFNLIQNEDEGGENE